MHPNEFNSSDNESWRFPQILQKDSMTSFIKNIEKHFFAKANIQICNYIESNLDITLQLNCNLSLVEVLNHTNLGTWGNFNNVQNSFLKNSLNELKKINNVDIRIDEFYLFLKDTSLIIKRTNGLNIAEQLEGILNKISRHYLFLTKGLSQKPYEIYIPVIEEKDFEVNPNNYNYCSSKSYSKFWGIYFEDKEDAVVYDLKKSCYLSTELNLCTQNII